MSIPDDFGSNFGQLKVILLQSGSAVFPALVSFACACESIVANLNDCNAEGMIVLFQTKSFALCWITRGDSRAVPITLSSEFDLSSFPQYTFHCVEWMLSADVHPGEVSTVASQVSRCGMAAPLFADGFSIYGLVVCKLGYSLLRVDRGDYLGATSIS